jgi:hypothetical protein
MQDYPEDAGDGMSQVFHGNKMLKDLPVGDLPPTVQVGDKIFWVNELLVLKSEELFIPKRFYYKTLSSNGKQLYAQGAKATFTSDVRPVINLTSRSLNHPLY